MCLVGDTELPTTEPLPTTTPPTIPTLRDVCLVGETHPGGTPFGTQPGDSMNGLSSGGLPATAGITDALSRGGLTATHGWIYFQNGLSAYYIRDGIKLELIKEGPVWVLPPETHIPALAAGKMHGDAAKVATYQAAVSPHLVPPVNVKPKEINSAAAKVKPKETDSAASVKKTAEAGDQAAANIDPGRVTDPTVSTAAPAEAGDQAAANIDPGRVTDHTVSAAEKLVIFKIQPRRFESSWTLTFTSQRI